MLPSSVWGVNCMLPRCRTGCTDAEVTERKHHTDTSAYDPRLQLQQFRHFQRLLWFLPSAFTGRASRFSRNMVKVNIWHAPLQQTGTKTKQIGLHTAQEGVQYVGMLLIHPLLTPLAISQTHSLQSFLLSWSNAAQWACRKKGNRNSEERAIAGGVLSHSMF